MTKFKDKTRGGHPARIYATDAGGEYPIHGAYRDRDDIWISNCWAAGGKNNLVREDPSPYDLIPVREPSEAAVEAARTAGSFGPVWSGNLRLALRAAYEIDGIGGGE